MSSKPVVLWPELAYIRLAIAVFKAITSHTESMNLREGREGKATGFNHWMYKRHLCFSTGYKLFCSALFLSAIKKILIQLSLCLRFLLGPSLVMWNWKISDWKWFKVRQYVYYGWAWHFQKNIREGWGPSLIVSSFCSLPSTCTSDIACYKKIYLSILDQVKSEMLGNSWKLDDQTNQPSTNR